MEKVKYICPMGCIEEQDAAGHCPVCGMKLVSKKEDKHHQKHIHQHQHHHKAEDFLRKFWLSLILTMPIILYADVWQKLTGLELPKFFGLEYLILLLASIVFFYGGLVFLKGAWQELISKNPGMMTLIGLAISAAYLYSVATIFFKIGKPLFWELSSLIVVMLLGHYFEMKSVSSAQKALQEIEKLLPDKAELITDGEVKKVNLNELRVGDLILIRPGGKIPADGLVVEGKSEVNESMITGESKPILKEKNSEVVAGTVNGDGMLKVKVTKIGEETFLAGIKRLIQEAQKSKSKLQVLADVFAKYLTFSAVGIGSVSFLVWLLLQKDFAFALERLVSVLVIACPHALGLAVPLVVAISTSLAVHNGFLIRNRLQLELARKINVVLFDKTGTLTSGKFQVKEVKSFNQLSEKEILQLAASLNQYSQHFIAQGILQKAKERKIEILKLENFENLTGRGVKGKIGEKIYYLGGDNLLKELDFKAPEIETLGTAVYLIDQEKNLLGAIILEDEIREESKLAIKDLHRMGIQVMMITGDKKEVADKVAKELEIDEYFAEVLPHQKVEKVKELQQRGLKVMMVGDGINDAPALMQADVGVAIGAGTNIAIESAGVILVGNDPRDIVSLIRLSQKTYQKMVQNLFWASGYNIVALPLAAGILYYQGIVLAPAVAAILMSLSTVIVAINAILLKRVKI